LSYDEDLTVAIAPTLIVPFALKGEKSIGLFRNNHRKAEGFRPSVAIKEFVHTCDARNRPVINTGLCPFFNYHGLHLEKYFFVMMDDGSAF
jgi:hypothetical protein